MLSGIITSLLLLLFVGGWFWLWRPALKTPFDQAARMPLEDEDAPAVIAASSEGLQ